MLPDRIWLFATMPWLMTGLWVASFVAPTGAPRRGPAEIIPFPVARIRRPA